MKKMLDRFTAAIAAILLCCSAIPMDENVASAEGLNGLSADELVSRMTIGWNLGNTLESHPDSYTIDMSPKKFATSWGNPEPTAELFETVKVAGFNTVRIPVTWYQHFAWNESLQTYLIDEKWMNYVQETVDYAYDLNLFVILNVHHEDWVNVSEFTDTTLADASVIMEDVWGQIADTFADYDQHLIFEALNEPRQTGIGSDIEWGSGDDNSRAYINTLNGIFVETVRNQGTVENAERLLMLPGYCADSDYEALSAIEVPENDDNIAFSVHAYKPYFFCGDPEFDNHTFPGESPYGADYGEQLTELFAELEKTIEERGIPIIIGEFGASDFNNTEARQAWAESYLSKAKALGIPCVLWDNNKAESDSGDAFGCLYRLTNTWYPSAVPMLETMMGIHGIEGAFPAYQEYVPPEFSWDSVPVNDSWIPLYYEESGTFLGSWDSIKITDWKSYMNEAYEFVLVYASETEPYLVLNGNWDKVYSEDDRNTSFTMHFSYEDFQSAAETRDTDLNDIPQLYIGAGSSDMTAYGLYAVPVQNRIGGDVNADGKFSVADAVALQKWLLCAPDAKLADWKAGDLCEDEKLNVLDLSIMKRELLSETEKNYVDVCGVEELFLAMKNAQPGDVIRVASGTYDYTSYQGAQKIDTSAEGTETAPITLTAADPENPPVITGTSTEHGYVLHITGDYWILENLKITTAQKGIVLDNSNHSIIRNCEVYNTGAEAIAIRDGSSYCTVKDSYIHDTGTITPGYGEGIYIGSAKSTTGFDYKCDYNTVDGCTFRNVAAEHVDVKEYTTGTEIMNCIFYGDGMTGENNAGSFVDIAGNDVNVHDNTGYRNENTNIVASFELHEQVDGWGYHCVFTDNTLYMDQPYGAVDTSRRMYVVDGWYSDFSVKNNLVDYGEGLVSADSWEYYNSDYVTYLAS